MSKSSAWLQEGTDIMRKLVSVVIKSAISAFIVSDMINRQIVEGNDILDTMRRTL